MPISYRLSELDGETIESVRIGDLVMSVEKEDKSQTYSVESMLEIPGNGYPVYLDLDKISCLEHYGSEELMKDIEIASRFTDKAIYIPDVKLEDVLFESNFAYADVCKRIGDYVISNINDIKFHSVPYLVAQYEYLRKDEHFSDLPDISTIIEEEVKKLLD